MSTVAAPAAVPRDDQCESWLLVFNCQVLGLANSLNLLSDEIRVEHYDPAAFRKNADEVLQRWDAFDRVLVAPSLVSLLPEELQSAGKVWRIPTIAFDAYHPDICYLRNDGKPFKGPMGDYHSAIAYAAHRRGLSVDETLRRYDERTYARLGYFDRWDGAKRQLLARFEEAGLDLRADFAGWSRNGTFMHSINHVHVRCLHDLAKVILRQAGKRVAFEQLQPHDNLLNGPVFPIYPEIGSRLGVQGGYQFKLGGQYRFIRLEQFVSESFELYAQHPGLEPMPEFVSMIDLAMATVGAHA